MLGSDVGQQFIRAGATLHADRQLGSIVTANDSRASVEGYLFLPVTLMGVTKVIKFYIIPDITTPMIFGVDFWKAFNLAPKIFNKLPLQYLKNNRGHTCVSEVRHLQPFDELTPDQKNEAELLIKDFEKVSFEAKGLGRTHLLRHKIDTGEVPPIKQRYYPLSPERLKELNRQLDEMLEMGVVEPSNSAWNNPVLLTPKPNGEWRFCLDSRKLNAVSKQDAYPLPYVSHILDQLRDARYLSSIDLKSAFWQIELDSVSSKEKTAFTVPGRGLFQFKVMCFGLTGAPATQQRLMDRLFGPEFGNKVFVYLDDIIICSSTFEEHISLLKRVLDKLRQANLTINLPKSCFFRRELKYLGYRVDEHGLHTDPSKVQSIVDFPTPKTRKEVKMFLGTASYYRRFIKNFSSIAAPLNALTSTSKKAPPFEWTAETETAFSTLKEALVSAPVLACPDFSQPFEIHCDASSFGIAGTLTQVINGEEHPIAYCSRSLNPAERNYSATEREALAVVFAVEHYRPYVEGGPAFKVITDHSSLKWFFNLTNPSGRLARWGCRLSPYNFTIEHRKGKDNVIPDALSRGVPVLEIKVSDTDTWFKGLWDKCVSKPRSCPNFIIKEDKLYRYSKNKFGVASDYDWKQVVPEGNRQELLRSHHSGELSPHFGVFKTYKRLALRYYWPNMYKDVISYVGKCDTCAAYKHSQLPPPGLLGDAKDCSKPFETISMDLVGPLPRSRAGFTFLLVVVCCFTKYCLLFPLRRAVGKAIAQKLEDGVFLVHGIPRTVIADNGTQFTGNEIRSLLERYKIPQVHFTPRYCPSVNTVERYNRTIMTAVSILVEDDHRSWDVNISKIQFAMNTSTNEVTRFTPFFLVHGREAISSGDVFGNDTVEQPTLACASRSSYANQLGALDSIFNKVKDALIKSHKRSARYYNSSRRHAEFEVGDTVWKKTYPQSDASKFFMAKLAPKYERCIIRKKLSPLVYELEGCSSGKNLGSWHIKDFKSPGGED